MIKRLKGKLLEMKSRWNNDSYFWFFVGFTSAIVLCIIETMIKIMLGII